MDWIKSLDSKDTITIVGIGLTFLIGIVNFIFNIFNSKKTIYINTITNKRVEWIYKLREYISTYISLASLSNHKHLYESGKSRSEYFDEIEKVNSQIKLHLNFLGDIDGEIIKTIDDMRNSIYTLYEILSTFHEGEEYIVVEGKKYKIDEFINNTEDENLKIAGILNSKIKELENVKDKLNESIKNLAKHTQIYLKLEWNRVKKEARRGKYGKSRINKEKKKLYEAYEELEI